MDIKKALPALLRRGPSQKTDYATKIQLTTSDLARILLFFSQKQAKRQQKTLEIFFSQNE
jgi:hypothetical protein